MSMSERDTLRDAMGRLLDQELTARARARAAERGAAGDGGDEASSSASGGGVADLERRLEDDVVGIAAKALRLPEEELDPTENLINYGIDSIAITEVMAQISRAFKISVSPATFFEAKHLSDLGRILMARHGPAITAYYDARDKIPAEALETEKTRPETAPRATNSAPVANIAAWLARHKAARVPSRTPSPRPARNTAPDAAAPIAVIAMDGRFPQSPDLDAFAAHLENGDDCIEEIPADRWDWRAVDGDPKKGPFSNVKYGGFVSGHDLFDAAFFGISPKEAELMDPQHRLFMECVWKLIESGGYAPNSLAGRKIALFVGINLQDYAVLANRAGIMEAVQLTGLGHSFCPNRISFLLDIHGPSEVVDTACSSSLAAVHRAVVAIRHEGCEMAIAGGTNLMLSPLQHVMYSKVAMISPDGRCKAFSRHANGFARGEGVGAVLLKRLDLAERDGDHILGVIRGSVESHSGGAPSLTAPNPKSQARMIAEVQRQADVDPRSISLIECHGTGTSLGDPVEIEGLKTAFVERHRELGLDDPAEPYCGIGSVKSNIGHTETAAGIAGLIKVLLSLRSGKQYRTLHCEEVNPMIDLAGSPFHLLQQGRRWDRPRVDGVEMPRRAGLSSFGAGGTNAHVIVEEYISRPVAPSGAAEGPFIVPLSAKSEPALRRMAERLRNHLAKPVDLADLAYTLQTGRDAMRVRAAFVIENQNDLVGQLDAFVSGAADAPAVAVVKSGRRAPVSRVDPTADGLNASAVAAQWLAGAEVDWQRAYEGVRRRRLPLPTYPFEHRRFWLPEVEGAAPAMPVPALPQGGSLDLREIAPDRFAVDLSGTEFFLDDHRVEGDPILPGVAYLELAHAAARKAGFRRECIRQVVWLKPMRVTAPLTAEIALTRDGNGAARLEIASLTTDGTRTQHMQARLDEIADVPAPTADLAALEAGHPRQYGADHVYRAFDAAGIGYGPAHRAIRTMALGTDAAGRPQVLTALRLPEGVAATADGFGLHPSLMDGAFQSAIGVTMDETGAATEETALPFALDRLEIFGPCTPEMRVFVRFSDDGEQTERTRTLDIDLMDSQGEVRVRMRGLATRVYGAQPATETLMFEPEWRDAGSEGTEPGDVPAAYFGVRKVLLCDAGLPDAAALGAALEGWDCRTLTADPSADVAARFLAHSRQLLAELQDLVRNRPSAPVLLQLVVADGIDSAALSGLGGMLRSARREHPWLWVQTITVNGGLAPAVLADLLGRDAQSPHWASIRHDGGRDEVAALVPRGHDGKESEPPLPWRENGVYLITGGGGGLGRQMAREIARRAPGASVVLVGRSSPRGDLDSWLAEAQSESGATICYESVDVTDADAVAGLVAEIRDRHGRLDGVVHAAGLIRDAYLADKSPEQLDLVMAPKVAGAIHLDQAVGAAELDFFVLCASVSGVFGNPGQADYAAANAFLDGFAAAREARRAAGQCRGRTVAIDWPLLRDGGMQIDGPTVELMTRTTGLVPLETRDAMAALYRILASDVPQVAVAGGYPQRVRDWALGRDKPPVVETAPPAEEGAIDTGDLSARVLAALTEAVCNQLKVAAADVAPDIELSEYGFDSITFTQFANELNDRFDLEITPTLFFEYQTLEELAAHLVDAHSQAMAAALGVSSAVPPSEAIPAAPEPEVPVSEPALAPAPAPAPVTPARPTEDAVSGAAVAIVGMSGIFPGADDLDAFWRNLSEGRDCIGEIPPDRWAWQDYWGDPASEADRTNVKWGGFIDGIAEFDAAFFGITASEARAMDPQQRLLLTQAWRTIEDAGYAPRSLSGSKTGVFIATADAGYGRLIAESGTSMEGAASTGLAPSLGPNRISFHFNFHGPSLAVETACSSALVAIHRAVESLVGGNCDAALAGGINVLLLPDTFIGFSKAGMLSPDGRCKPFSAQANGYARGEGVGLLFLKRLVDAERDGDRILAVVRATAENHGGRANSLTAPNPKAQAELLRTVYGKAGFDPRTVSYIEAHGTGTPLGDPIEVEALSAAFADLDRDARSVHGAISSVPCGIGSVKSNIGHLELAAGVAGVIKTVLQMRHGVLTKTLHCDEVNPYLKLDGSRFHVVRENEPWARPRDAEGRELARRAGVSSFGFGGANAHVVIEEYRGADRPGDTPSAAAVPPMIVLSAKTEPQLTEWARRLRVAVAEESGETFLRNLAYTLQVCRDAMEFRVAFRASSVDEVKLRFDDFIEGRDNSGVHVGRVKPNRETIAVLERDEDLKRSLVGLPARGKTDNLLQLWAKGLTIDWAALYGDDRPRKVALPGYPFTMKTYWVGSRPSTAVEGGRSDGSSVAPESPAAFPVPETASPPKEEPAEPAVSSVSEGDDGGTGEADAEARALAALVEVAARVLEVDPSALETDTELGEFGFDSITMTGFASKVNDELGLSLTPADFFEFATLDRLAHYIADDFAASSTPEVAESFPVESASPPPSVAPVRSVATPDAAEDDPVAIVGISCRFPMAADADAFWDNLLAKRDCISEIPPERWDWRAIDGDPKTETGKTDIRWAGFIDGVFDFDPLFFGISPREAKLMDPQQRLILMHVWKALEDSGHAPRSFAGRSVGLFVGTSPSGYQNIGGGNPRAEGYVATGATPSVGPNRVSFIMDWHGPSEPIETACSSSLVAIHRAIQAMRAGDCDLAVTGGVNTIVTPEAHINFAKAGMLSPDGRCKTFSEDANGYVRGEGVGMLVLKRLSEAERDGDPIHAVIRGSVVNHGGRANSLTAPNTVAQTDLLKRAYDQAGIDPRTVGYIEAHGTGTSLGDPVEVNALKSAFRDLLADAPGMEYEGARCGLGSVKTNIGHLELAAGVAGVIKVLMQMRHRKLAASLHSNPPNPFIDFTGSPFFVVADAQPWRPARDADGRELPLRAGISSFGFGGVNAHVVLEEYAGPVRPARPVGETEPQVIPLSAYDEDRLRDQARQVLDVLDAGRIADADLPDLAYTLQLGREAMRQRLALVAATAGDLRTGLLAYLNGDTSAAHLGRLDAKPSETAGRIGADAGPDAAARHWVRGRDVDWRALHRGERRRLSLPTYPFARDEYRIDRPMAAAPKPATATRSAALHESAPPSPDEGLPVSLDPEAFYLRDHRIEGARFLPGAMGLELASAGHRRWRGIEHFVPVSLRQVVWARPLVVETPTTVRLAFSPGNGDTVFRLASDDEETAFVQGKVGEIDGSPSAMDVDAIRGRCPASVGTDWFYDTFRSIGIDYGPSFRAVTGLFVGENEILARLRLPEAAETESAGLRLNPSMLDGAFQAILGFFHADGATGAGVPFAIDCLDAVAPTGADMWTHLRLRPPKGSVWKLDIDLADVDGKVCVRIEGLSIRTLNDPAGPQIPGRAKDETVPENSLRTAARDHLAQILAREFDLPVAKIEPSAPLEAYGIDSIMIVRLTDELEKDFGPLPTTLFFDCQTLDALVDYFLETHWERLAELTGGEAAPERESVEAPPPSARPGAGPSVDRTKAPALLQPVAIVGLAGRYPGARTVDEFWRNLAAGRDGITEIPATRWDHSRFFDPVRGKPGKTNSKWGGFIDDFDRFDPLFFNISPSEAEYLDPQERLFLQCAWEVQEDAGYTRATVAPGEPPLPGGNVGVFVGVMYHEYQLYGAERTQAGQPLALSGSPASIANRVSYVFDFHGPSLTLDSMCSSSLTATHLACESIRSGSCDAAIAGGVNLTLHPNKYLGLAQGRFTSSTGRCESFGRGGDGYVPGEGVGAVLLKPLDKAIADGDQIYGVIRGTAVNHGGKTNGYTVPNPHAQAAVIERALIGAGVDPRAISYIEAHGTGTKLGDPIEISALTRAFRNATPDNGFCAIGSVKSNIGHCESAAGIAGLTKVLLQMKHGQIAPSLHAETLNPGIDFTNSPFVVQRRLGTWHRPRGRSDDGQATVEMPRIAGLSSFGAGGSNAHLIVEEFVPAPSETVHTLPAVFPWSARDGDRLAEMLRRFAAALPGIGDAALPSVAHVLQEGRETFETRLAIVADDRDGLAAALERVLAGETDIPHVHRSGPGGGENRMPLDALIEARDLDGLAAAWADGAEVDWRWLRGDRPAPRKISLPTYPFALERYWIPGDTGEERPVAPPMEMPERPVSIASADLPLMFAPYWRARAAAADREPEDRVVVVLCDFPAQQGEALSRRLGSAECLTFAREEGNIKDRFADYAARLLAVFQRIFAERPARALVQVVVPVGVFEGLAGLVRSAHFERSSVRCQMIGIGGVPDDLAENLIADRASGDTEIRYAADGRRVRVWREIRPVDGDEDRPPYRDDGVYLITGGAGGVGLRLCDEIATVARRPVLWLAGRSPLDNDLRRRLEALPVTPVYRQVDVTRADEVAALVHEIRRCHGRLDGIVHAAGVLRDKLLVNKTAEDLRAVLAPKVRGAVNLDAASADCDLDFMVLFSSATGALGNAGQTDYAAGNAFLDAFAAARNARVECGECRGRTIAIDWPYWRDGGMTLDDTVIKAAERGFGVRPLETDAAMAAMRDALTRTPGEVQMLVLDGDRERLRAALLPADAADGPVSEPETAEEEAPIDSGLHDRVEAYLTDRIADILKVPAARLAPDETLDRFGMDSVLAMQIVETLSEDLGDLPQTLLLEYPKIALLTETLIETHGAELRHRLPGDAGRQPAIAAERNEAVAVEETPSQVDSGPGDIAVIAVDGRYPGADAPEALWALLREGRDCITEVPAERWDHAAIFSPDKGKSGTSYCKWGGFLSEVDKFDADFFGVSPRDAALMDPQERLFLETTWHLLERAAHTRGRLRDAYDSRVGVFVGAMYQPYHAFKADEEREALVSLSSYASIANRVSFFFDLQGPSVAVDTMCSSGLQAVHFACQSLQRGECRLAIAGGVNLSLHPYKYLGLSRSGMLGSSADSRSFADGDGYLPAEGVGAVLLKPLADAQRDGDRVLAVVKGSAINHVGHSAGFGVPSGEAQARLIGDNLRASGVDARSISYVEAAANGSALGDAIEFRALARAFRTFTEDSGFCAIGSVKSNMGHAEAASGMAQLTKVLLQFQHRQLAPSIEPDSPNAEVDFSGTPFVLQDRLADWVRPVLGGTEIPRRAAISSFGAGGSNVHLILEEGPDRDKPEVAAEETGERRLVFSARTEDGLREWLGLMADFVRDRPDLSMARLAHVLRHGRERMDCRVRIVADGREDLLAKLTEAAKAPSFDEAAFDIEGDDDEDDIPEAVPPLVLPGYPFARQRHWITDARPQVATPETPASAMLDETVGSLILRTLSEDLGLAPDAVDPDRTFRAHGADSMFALRLIHMLSEAFGVEVTHRDLAAHPAPRALAAFVAELRAATDEELPPPEADVPDVSGDWPLSEGQKGLWVLQTLYPETSAYNVPLAFEVEGIDEEVLRRTCAWTIERFPILGMRIDDGGSEPVMVGCPIEEPLAVLDIPEGDGPVAVARSRARRPFDLGAEPPARFEFLRRDGMSATGIFLVTVHHIVFDGVSAVAFAQAFWKAYGIFVAGGMPEREPQTEYPAFVAWERDHLRSARGAAQREYWLRQLAGDPSVTSLPADRSAPPDQGGDGQSLETMLPPDLIASVREASAALGVNPSVLFLGALNILLYRHTGEAEAIVGVPTMGRPARRFERTIGYFANMMPLRTELSGADEAASVLRGVQEWLTQGLDNADYPFAALTRDLHRTPQDPPLYQVSYAYQNFLGDPSPVSAAGARVTHLPEVRQEGDVAFGLELFEEGEAIRLVAVYDGARFDAVTVERLVGHYIALVEGICARPEAAVASLPMMGDAARARILEEWSRTGPSPKTDGFVVDMILERAAKTPEAVAVVCGDETLTYRRLTERSNRLAAHLRALGVGAGVPVAVLLKRNPDSIVALLAVLAAGGIWVPLDAASPGKRLASILSEVGAGAIVTDSMLEDRLTDVEHRVPVVVQLDRDRRAIGRRSPRPLNSAVTPGSPAYIIHTSGSTGRPKGVAVSHKAIAEHCIAVTEAYGLRRKDAVLQFAAHSVDIALEQILPTLARGARLVMRGDALWTPDDCAREFLAHGVTVADLPPTYLRELLIGWAPDSQRTVGKALRLVIVGGEALPPETVRLWQASPLAPVRLLNAYGPTEATVTCLIHEVGASAPEGDVPIGRPLPGVEVYILDGDGNPVPEGVPGELHIGGSRLTIGYHGQPALTESRFIANPFATKGGGGRLYRTGDLACFLPGGDGVIGFRGRRDDQIKIRGFRIELGEIEQALRDFGCRHVAVVAEERTSGERVLTAFVVPGPERTFDEAAARTFLAARLPDYMVPSAFAELEALPLLISGKVDRGALAGLAVAPSRSRGDAEVPPRNAVETRLSGVWAEVLGGSDDGAGPGVFDDFFACGGHSLLALRLLTVIRREFGRVLSIAALIEAPTIAAQAELLGGDGAADMSPDDAVEEEGRGVLIPLREGNGGRPLFCVHPVGGGVTCYADLARRLLTDRPVYGIQTPGLEGGGNFRPAADLASLAATYVAAVREMQPTGPYALAGWSLGGMIAFEMARQLESAGDSVEILGLIDSYAPALLAKLEAWEHSTGNGAAEARLVRAYARNLLASSGETRDLPDGGAGLQTIQDLLAQPWLADAVPGMDEGVLLRLYDVFKSNSLAAERFEPRVCNARIVLFSADGMPVDDITRGWRPFAAAGLSVHVLPGDHYSILRSPHVGELAALLSTELSSPPDDGPVGRAPQPPGREMAAHN